MKQNLIEGEQFVGQIEFSKNGNAGIQVEEKNIFIHKKNTLNSLHFDKVKVEFIKVKNRIECKVLQVESRFRTQFVGTVQINKNNTFVIPDNQKTHVDFYIKGGLVAKAGEKVLVEMTKWENTKSPQAKIIKIIGEAGTNETEMNAIMYEYNLPIDFPKEVLLESELVPEEISVEEIKNRLDYRNVSTFTIDPVDAKDFDDALSIKLEDDSVEVGVHIADVGHYVKKGTKLDEEAFKRATSVYLVDRCVPMLPERLSNGICSLKPNVDRLAFSVIFKLGLDGSIKDTWMGKTVIHSDRRFTYEQAQEIIEGGNGDFYQEIRMINSLAKNIRKKRIEDGSIELGGTEVKFRLAEDNKKPIGVYFKEQKDSNKLIEEFMLLANKSVAKKLSDESWHNIYRIHDTPNSDKLNELNSICKSFGYQMEILEESKNLKRNINYLIKEIKDKPEQNMIETLITRSMSKAKYTIKNIGHYGLGFTHYSHFTSPIRRYPDLITHRILFDYLSKKGQKNPNEIEEEAKWCSQRELIASKAQRDSIKYKQAEYLQDKIGTIFSGIISGVSDWGIYVELKDSKCEGLIRLNSSQEKWTIDMNNYTANTKDRKIRLGDAVDVVVKTVNLEKKQIDFSLI